jgi:hypothetical protein
MSIAYIQAYIVAARTVGTAKEATMASNASPPIATSTQANAFPYALLNPFLSTITLSCLPLNSY